LKYDEKCHLADDLEAFKFNNFHPYSFMIYSLR